MDYSSERFSIAIPEMEQQHRYLYDLFDRLEQKSSVTSPATMNLLLREIERYLLFHFSCEEHLMRMYGFPQFAAHQSDHEQFSEKLVGYLDEFDMGVLNPARLRFFLTGWLMEHSSLSDADYVPWIQQQRDAIHTALPPQP